LIRHATTGALTWRCRVEPAHGGLADQRGDAALRGLVGDVVVGATDLHRMPLTEASAKPWRTPFSEAVIFAVDLVVELLPELLA